MTREEAVEAIVAAKIPLQNRPGTADCPLIPGAKYLACVTYSVTHGGEWPTDDQLRTYLQTHRVGRSFWDTELDRRQHESY